VSWSIISPLYNKTIVMKSCIAFVTEIELTFNGCKLDPS